MKRMLFSFMSLALVAVAIEAHAGTKEEIMRLQSDVLALQNQIRLLEKSFNEQTGGIKSLVTQLNDQVGQSNVILTKISTALETQMTGGRSSDQVLLQEVRTLSMKLDEASTRISALAQQVADMKLQSKPIGQRGFLGSTDASFLSAEAIYNEAYNDLVQGQFDLAIEAFTAFVNSFPANERADDALYNIGEANYNQNKFPQAIAAFTRVVNDYPGGDKVAAALFKRGKAEVAIKERDNAIADFRTVVQKYPNSPEASLAQRELESLGVSLSKVAKPNPASQKTR